VIKRLQFIQRQLAVSASNGGTLQKRNYELEFRATSNKRFTMQSNALDRSPTPKVRFSVDSTARAAEWSLQRHDDPLTLQRSASCAVGDSRFHDGGSRPTIASQARPCSRLPPARSLADRPRGVFSRKREVLALDVRVRGGQAQRCQPSATFDTSICSCVRAINLTAQMSSTTLKVSSGSASQSKA
jgi:hypothetical protein